MGYQTYKADRLVEAISYYFDMDLKRAFAILAFVQGLTLLMSEGKEAFFYEKLLIGLNGAQIAVSEYSSWCFKFKDQKMSERSALCNFNIELRNNKISWVDKFSHEVFMTEDDIDIITYFIDTFEKLSTTEINGFLFYILGIDKTNMRVLPQEELYEGFLNFTKKRGTGNGFVEWGLRGSNSL